MADRIEHILVEFDFADGNINATDEDAVRMATEIALLRSVIEQVHHDLNLQFHGITWNRLSAAQIAAVDRALAGDHGSSQARHVTT